MVVDEGLTRNWPWWAMHRRRASESLGIEVPNVMEKDKWMFSLRNHATMKNHISLSVNLYWTKIWSDLEIKCGNWLYNVKCSKWQPLKSQWQSKIKCWNPDEVKRNEMARFNIVQPLKSKEEWTQVRWVKHNGLIHNTSHWTRKNKKNLVSQTGVSSFACNSYISNSGCSDSKTGCSSVYWLVCNG
jgi:hypothetical protein